MLGGPGSPQAEIKHAAATSIPVYRMVDDIKITPDMLERDNAELSFTGAEPRIGTSVEQNARILGDHFRYVT